MMPLISQVIVSLVVMMLLKDVVLPVVIPVQYTRILSVLVGMWWFILSHCIGVCWHNEGSVVLLMYSIGTVL
jgi:hypothetical protein